MTTIISYTDIEQSKKLAEILPPESADMYYPCEGVSPKFGVALSISNNIPCWSLAALLGVLPVYHLSSPNPLSSMYCCRVKEVETYANNQVDACVEMILKLNELKML